MRTPRAFIAGVLRVGDLVDLPPAEARHLARVLRRRPGDSVELVAGAGGLFAAEVTAVSEGEVGPAVQVRVLAPAPSPPPSVLPWRLGLALVKGDAWELSIRMAAELGFRAIAPVLAERSISRPSDAGAKAVRWQKVADEAAKQCGRSVPLAVGPLRVLDDLLGEAGPDPGYIALPLGPFRLAAPGAERTGQEATVLVGPEGGFTSREVAAAQAAGYRPLGLPTPVLRTPTAVALVAALGLVAVHGFAVDLPQSFS